MAATPHDDVTRRIVEMWRMMARFNYVNLLLVVRVAESLMREQPIAVASAQRSGLRARNGAGSDHLHHNAVTREEIGCAPTNGVGSG
jgi:hypothetical protein